MIIDPKDLRTSEIYKLMIGSIVPRPIALVSTISKSRVLNLAPFSFFSGICSNPPTIMFAPAIRYDGCRKDTIRNIRETDGFVVNIVSESIADQMVKCSTDYPPEIDEFEISGLTPAPSMVVTPPRVKESLINLECSLDRIIKVGAKKPGSAHVVLGKIQLFHIQEKVYNDGRINIEDLQPVGRLAGNDYARIRDIFSIVRQIRPPEDFTPPDTE